MYGRPPYGYPVQRTYVRPAIVLRPPYPPGYAVVPPPMTYAPVYQPHAYPYGAAPYAYGYPSPTMAYGMSPYGWRIAPQTEWPVAGNVAYATAMPVYCRPMTYSTWGRSWSWSWSW